jgi:prevent-host-death family protein
MEITSTEAQNNFGQYMKYAQYEDIIVTRNGTEVGTAVVEDGKVTRLSMELNESGKSKNMFFLKELN